MLFKISDTEEGITSWFLHLFFGFKKEKKKTKHLDVLLAFRFYESDGGKKPVRVLQCL